MSRNISPILALTTILFAGGCAQTSVEKVYGTYVANYPFGVATIVLNEDGSFVQKVVVTNDPPPQSIEGHWKFDTNNGYVTFDEYLPIDDGFGRLNSNWRNPYHGLAAALPVEQLLFRTVIGAGTQHPYVKQ